MKVIIWLLFAVAFIYSINDAYSTYIILKLGGSEANPLMQYIINIWDNPMIGLLIFKISTFMFLEALLFIYNRKEGI